MPGSKDAHMRGGVSGVRFLRAGAHRSSRLLRIAVVSVLVAAVTLAVGSAQAARAASVADPVAGLDCGCTVTGPYVAPAVGVKPSVSPAGNSPHGTYTVSAAAAGGSTTVTVTNSDTKATLLRLSDLTGDEQWGFSPDDGRFLIWNVTDQQTGYTLYDLTTGAAATPLVRVTGLAISGAQFSFSPRGNWLTVGTTQDSSADVFVWSAHHASSTPTWTSGQYTLSSPPGVAGQTFGSAAWGFSPDALELRFVFGQLAVGTPRLEVVDLSSGTASIVRDQADVSSAIYEFSPCADVLGVESIGAGSSVSVSLLSTTTGAELASTAVQGSKLTLSVTKSATSYQHVLTVDGTADPLAPDTAAQACAGSAPPPPGGPPTGVLAVAAVRGAEVSWTPPPTGADGTPTGYLVEAFAGGVDEGGMLAPSGSTSLVEPSLAASSLVGSYTFTVTAQYSDGAAGTSAPSNAITVLDSSGCGDQGWTTGPASGTVDAPGPPGWPSVIFDWAVHGNQVAVTNRSTGSDVNLSTVYDQGDGSQPADYGTRATSSFPVTDTLTWNYWGNYVLTVQMSDDSLHTTEAAVVIHLVPPTAPAGDDFAAAPTLPVGTATGTTVGATCEAGEPTPSGAATVWYRYQPPTDQVLQLDGQASGVAVTVYSGPDLADLTALPDTLSTAGDTLGAFLRRVKVTGGTTYWIQVASPIAGRSFSISTAAGPPPGNDSADEPSPINTGADGTIAGDLSFATPDPSEPQGSCLPNLCRILGSVWYDWTATADRWITFVSPQSLALDIFAVAADGGLHLVGSGDTEPPDPATGFEGSGPGVEQQPGVHYELRVATEQSYQSVPGYWTGSPIGGPFTLQWHDAPSNDLFDSPTAISGDTGSVDGTNDWGYLDLPDPNSQLSDRGANVWYAWTAPSSGPEAFSISSPTLTRPGISVYTKNPDGSGTLISPARPAKFDNDVDASRVGIDATAGQTYYISVEPVETFSYTATMTGAFTLSWQPNPPTVTGLSPASGAVTGGDPVAITGTGFTGADEVDVVIDGTTLPVTGDDLSVVSDTQITVTTPALPDGADSTDGQVADVRVLVGDATSAVTAADRFTYRTPATVAVVTPRSVDPAGGQTVTVDGTGLTDADQIVLDFDGGSLTLDQPPTVVSDHRLSFTMPAGFDDYTGGPVHVLVHTPGGITTDSPADQIVVGPVPLPSAPALTASANGPTEIDLSWPAVAGAISYQVVRAATAGGPWQLIGTTTSTSWTDPGRTTGATYFYALEATTADGTSELSPAAEASTSGSGPVTTVPGAPTGLTATPAPTSVRLDWTAPGNDGGTPITGYQVRRGPSAGDEAATPVAALGPDTTSYVDDAVAPGATYFYTVTALNSVGPSTPSGEVHALPGTAPSITSPDTTSFTVGMTGAFTIVAAGQPAATLTTTGDMPAGLTLHDNGDGTASLAGTPAAGTTGVHTLTITAGNALGQVDQTLHITVGKAATTTTLTSAPGSPRLGQAITFTAQVATAGGSSVPPAGTVSFTVDSKLLGAPAPLVDGRTSSVAISNLAAGSHTVIATYSGDGDHTGSQANSDITVGGCSTPGRGGLTVTGTTCFQGGTITGPVAVRPGATLQLTGTTVHGPITAVNAAAITLCGATVTGPITLTGTTAAITLGSTTGCSGDRITGALTMLGAHAVTMTGARLTGALRIAQAEQVNLNDDTADGPVSVTLATGLALTGSTVTGPLTVTGIRGTATISGTTVHGPTSLLTNTARVTLLDNTILGPVLVLGNLSSTAVTLSSNHITGPLSCSLNRPAPVDPTPNTLTTRPTGQCADFARHN